MSGPSRPTSALGVPVYQVAVVVDDVEQAVRDYWEALGIGPWRVYTYGPPELTGMTYRGEPAEIRCRAALAMSGEVMFEVVQSLGGPDVWREQLEARGPSLHHVAFYVDDFDAAMAELAARGWQTVQTFHTYGKSRDGHQAYLEHPVVTGLFAEVVQPPSERNAPDYVYPEPPNSS